MANPLCKGAAEAEKGCDGEVSFYRHTHLLHTLRMLLSNLPPVYKPSA